MMAKTLKIRLALSLSALFLAIATAPIALAQAIDQQVRFEQVFTGIVLPTISVPVPNVGQGSHTVTVFYSTAIADVPALQIRIEASFDNSAGSYFPISEDIVLANFNGDFAYAIVKANGTFPFIRINAIAVDAILPMDAWYTGSTFPIGAVVYDPGTVRYITYSTNNTIANTVVTNIAPVAGQTLYYNSVTNSYELTPAPTIDGQYYSWDTVTGTWILTAAAGGVGGAGVADQVAYWTAANTIGGESSYQWKAATDELWVGPVAVGYPAQVFGGIGDTLIGHIQISDDGSGLLGVPWNVAILERGIADATFQITNEDVFLTSRGTLAAPTATVAGDEIHTHSYFGYAPGAPGGAGYYPTNRITVKAFAIGAGDSWIQGQIDFWTNRAGFGPIPVLSIIADQIYVGGTSQNSAQLALHTSALATYGSFTPVAGSTSWCNNCNQANPCTDGGAGALAIYTGAQWNCQH